MNVAFNPALVSIKRHRLSVTQGEVSVFYGLELLGRFGDDIALAPDGLWSGWADAYWVAVAEKIIRERADAARTDETAKSDVMGPIAARDLRMTLGILRAARMMATGMHDDVRDRLLAEERILEKRLLDAGQATFPEEWSIELYRQVYRSSPI